MAHMFVPGPVDVAPEVQQAIAQPMLPHRSKEYEAIHRRAAEKAQQVFYTQYRVFIGTHTPVPVCRKPVSATWLRRMYSAR